MAQDCRVCIPGRDRQVGGPRSFQLRLTEWLEERGVDVTYDPGDTPYDAALVLSGTSDIPRLLREKSKGVRIVQRMDGLNWLHRKTRRGLRHTLRAARGNLAARVGYTMLADHVVFQSEFVKDWISSDFGAPEVPSSVIYNGVDTSRFRPADPAPLDRPLRLIAVEGRWTEEILRIPIGLLEEMRRRGVAAELEIAGEIPAELGRALAVDGVHPLGLVDEGELLVREQEAHIFVAAEINPACPNSVVEALACGLPVVGFATGAVAEVVGDGGVCPPYGGDPWKLDPPDVPALADAVFEVRADLEGYRRRARSRALEAFDLERMASAYLAVLRGRVAAAPPP